MTEGVVLDSNLLLLLTLGSFDPRTLKSFKRLSMFSLNDLRLLQNFAIGRQLVVTPHVWTEVSNLAGSLPSPTKHRFFDYLKAIIPGISESFVQATQASEHPAFALFGLTDTAICMLAENNLIVTEDGRLRDYMLRQGRNVIGLSTLREDQERGNRSIQ